MVLDHKIQAVRNYLGISNFQNWAETEPRHVLATPGVGKRTLDLIRLYLAGHGITLKNDLTPEHWLENLRSVRMVQQITDEEDEAVVCPFTILVDSNEQEPFSFVGLRADADQKNAPLVVRTLWRSLGRHPYQFGDYSIDGYVGRVHVERKSIDDCQQTILDFRGGRERFEQELANLARIEASIVVVEGSLDAVLAKKNDRRTREHRQVQKQLFRSILAFQQDFKVPWVFAGSRRMAEIATFRFLERFWNKRAKRAKAAESMLAEL